MKFCIRLIAPLAAFFILHSAHAAIVTYGKLQSDTNGQVIRDTVTGREYLRLNEQYLSYASLQTALAPSGAWEGWTIADSKVSDDFIRALLGGKSDCDGAVAYGKFCGEVTGYVDGSFGASWFDDVDYYFYRSSLDTPLPRPEYDVGLVEVQSFTRPPRVFDYDDWDFVSQADRYSSAVSPCPLAGGCIPFLLYREAANIPTPGTLPLLFSALGMAVLWRARRVPFAGRLG